MANITINSKTHGTVDIRPIKINPTGIKQITANGTHDVSQYANAQVNVPNPSTGTKNITTNGTHDVTNFASANVNVPASEVCSGTKNIISEGLHNVLTYASANVSIPKTVLKYDYVKIPRISAHFRMEETAGMLLANCLTRHVENICDALRSISESRLVLIDAYSNVDEHTELLKTNIDTIAASAPTIETFHSKLEDWNENSDGYFYFRFTFLNISPVVLSRAGLELDETEYYDCFGSGSSIIDESRLPDFAEMIKSYNL